MTNGSSPDHHNERKNVEKKNSPKQSKKGMMNSAKEQSTTKERTQ